MGEERARYLVEREREGNLGGFSFVDVATEGCEGWLNLFWGGYPVALVSDVHLAAEMREAIMGQADRAECIDNLVGKLYRERGTLATELERKDAELRQLRDSIATIAWEAFGPFPIQSAEENLKEIEQGVARHRQKLCEAESEKDDLRTALDATSKLANDSLTELEQLRPKLAELKAQIERDFPPEMEYTEWVEELARRGRLANKQKGE